MADWIIKFGQHGKFGSDVEVDDVIVSPDGTRIRIIEKDSHNRKEISSIDVQNIRYKDALVFHGDKFNSSEIPKGWKRP